MVYGCPTLNLSQVSGTEYDSQDGAVSTWTVAEIFVGPLIFVSPSHVRLHVQLNSRSGNVTTIQNNSYASTLSAWSKNQLAFPISNTIGSQTPGTDDYSITHVLDANFTSATGDNRVDYIDMDCLVIIDGLSLDASIAKTFDIGPNDTAITYRFYIEWIESAFVIVGKNTTPGRISRYAQHCCLPPSPVAGQTHRIKNGSTSTKVYLHAFDKQIDNKNSNLSFSTSYTSAYPGFYQTYTFSENGFILPPLHACMLVYDGAKWLIQEYFNGARMDPTFNWWAYSPVPATIPAITKPVVVCDIAPSAKLLQLPNPAGSLKFVRIIVISSTQNMTNALFIFPPTGTIMEDNRGNSMYLRAAFGNGNANACITFISDGVQWWVANIYEGTNSFFTTQTIERPLSQKPITVIRASGVDGVRLPAITHSQGAAETFVKMDASSPYNGVVIGTTDSTNVRIGSGANNCIYAGAPWKNYTAASLIGMFNGNNTVYFVTGYFSGF